MNNNKKILVPAIAIGILLVIVIGASFAYFASTYTQSGNNQTVNVTTKTITAVTYTTGASVSASNVALASGAGNYTLSSPQFNIFVKADSANGTTTTYDINMNTTASTFLDTGGEMEDITCSLYRSTASGTKGTLIASNVDCRTVGVHKVYSESITLAANVSTTYYYTLDIVLYNSPEVVNTNAGKSFAGTITITNMNNP